MAIDAKDKIASELAAGASAVLVTRRTWGGVLKGREGDKAGASALHTIPRIVSTHPYRSRFTRGGFLGYLPLESLERPMEKRSCVMFLRQLPRPIPPKNLPV